MKDLNLGFLLFNAMLDRAKRNKRVSEIDQRGWREVSKAKANEIILSNSDDRIWFSKREKTEGADTRKEKRNVLKHLKYLLL